jgi:uncharacterized alpha-E superfamily protein
MVRSPKRRPGTLTTVSSVAGGRMTHGDYFCGLCSEVVTDEFVLAEEDNPRSAFHYPCAQKIAEALAKVKRTRGRETNKQADPLEERVKRMEAVWKLWLSDAEKGSISQGTFDAMKHLLGMETA